MTAVCWNVSNFFGKIFSFVFIAFSACRWALLQSVQSLRKSVHRRQSKTEQTTTNGYNNLWCVGVDSHCQTHGRVGIICAYKRFTYNASLPIYRAVAELSKWQAFGVILKFYSKVCCFLPVFEVGTHFGMWVYVCVCMWLPEELTTQIQIENWLPQRGFLLFFCCCHDSKHGVKYNIRKLKFICKSFHKLKNARLSSALFLTADKQMSRFEIKKRKRNVHSHAPSSCGPLRQHSFIDLLRL